MAEFQRQNRQVAQMGNRAVAASFVAAAGGLAAQGWNRLGGAAQRRVANYVVEQAQQRGGQFGRQVVQGIREYFADREVEARGPADDLGRRDRHGNRVGQEVARQEEAKEPRQRRARGPDQPRNGSGEPGNYNQFSHPNMPKKRTRRGSRKTYSRPRMGRSLQVKPDGLYKERVKFVKDVYFRLDGAGGASCFLNVHHSRVYPQAISAQQIGANCFVDDANTQFIQVAGIFQKYAIYGVSVRLIQKEFFPENSTQANVRGIASGTVPDYDPSTQANLQLLTAQPAARLQNQTDFKYFVPRDSVSRFYKVGKWNKTTGGQYWFDCVNYEGSSTPQTPSVITTPTPQMSRVTCFTWDLSDVGWGNVAQNSFAAKAEITYYVAFKDRRWSLQG